MRSEHSQLVRVFGVFGHYYLDLPCPINETFLFHLVCRSRLDLTFLIDGSGSIEHYGKGNFKRCLNFVRRIVSQFNTDNGQTRVGIVVYSSRPRVILNFRRRRKRLILRAIKRIRYPRGGTRTGYAMRHCYRRVFRYARRGVRKVIALGLFENTISLFYVAAVVRRVDNAIHYINHYPLATEIAIHWINHYPLDKSLSTG